MFDPNSSSLGATPKASAISQSLSLLGKAVGIGASVLATPFLFELTRQPLESYLTRTYGPDLGSGFTYLIGGVEAVLLYSASRLLIISAATWALVSLSARRLFPHQ